MSWTIADNAPAGKIGTLREAVSYLQSLGATTQTYLVISKREESESKLLDLSQVILDEEPPKVRIDLGKIAYGILPGIIGLSVW